VNDSDVPKFVTQARALLPAWHYGRRVAPYFERNRIGPPGTRRQRRRDVLQIRGIAPDLPACGVRIAGEPHNFQRRRLTVETSALLAIDASDNSEVAIRDRLTENLKCVSAGETRYAINLSLSAARINICSNASRVDGACESGHV
jgi:hypothetical protein